MQQTDTEVIDVASEYVISNTKTKQVEIKNLEELKLKLNTNEIEYIQQNVNIVNNLLNQRIVTMLDDGSMWLTNEIRLRGGKINRSEVKFLGLRRYNNQANTKKAADELIKNGKQLKNITNIHPVVLGILGLTGGVLGTIAGAVGLGNVAGNWAYNIGLELRKKNNTYGTVLDINWMGSYKVWKQTNKTQ